MTRPRRLAPFVAAALVALGLGWAYRPMPVPVTTTVVTRGPLEVVLEQEAQTRVRERFVVTAPIAGWLSRVQLHAGDAVSQGQTLAVLTPLPASALDARVRAEAVARAAQARAALRAAETDAAAATATADVALREAARLRPLVDTGDVSKLAWERAEAEASRSAAVLASARAAIEVARQESRAADTWSRYSMGARDSVAQRLTLAAPIAGRVLQVRREDEGVVAAGEPLMTLGDPHSLEIVAEVLSSDAVRLGAGMGVTIRDWGGACELEGRVRSIEPTAFTKISALGVEEQRVLVRIDILSPPDRWAALGDRFRVQLQIVIQRSERAVRVPHSSLFRSGEQWAVFVVDEGRAERRAVTVGLRGLVEAEVTQGLRDGERVVTYPDEALASGRRVRERE